MESVGNVTLVAEGKAAEIESLIGGSVEAMGYGLIRLQLSRGTNAKLQVMVERTDGAGMTVDDCARVSKTVEAILDVENPIEEPYVLEVSSPGIDRPLTRLSDFTRFSGFEAKVEIRLPIEGRRRFKGRILGLDGSHVKLATQDEEVALAFSNIAKAKLLLTDELLEASARAKAEAPTREPGAMGSADRESDRVEGI